MKQKGLSTRALKAAFLSAMEKTFGNITVSAQSVGISRTIVYKWKEKDLKFAAKVESEDYGEMYLDALESKLNKLAFKDENPTVMIFLAKTKGKSRGYIERNELTGKDGKDLIPKITIEIINSPDQVKKPDETTPQNDTGS